MALSVLRHWHNDREKYATIEVNSEDPERKVPIRRRTEPSVKLADGKKYVPSYATDIRETMQRYRNEVS